MFRQTLFFLAISILILGNITHAAEPNFKDSTTGMEFIFVKGGCYLMGDAFGDSNRMTSKETCVDDMYVGKYEVTQAEWKKIMGTNPSKNTTCGDNCPVEQISWNEAQGFIKKLNGLSNRKYRLPTDAEWEYACREGGKSTTNNKKEASAAWYDSKFKKGGKSVNGLGIYEMGGSIWEWEDDLYYKKGKSKKPKTDAPRVMRGGGAFFLPKGSRCAFRTYNTPDYRFSNVGIRLFMTSK